MSYSVLRKPGDVAKSGLRRHSCCPVGRATTSGTGRAVVTPLIVVAFLINGSHPQEPEFWQMKREWKRGRPRKGPERACFLIKFLLTKGAFFEKSEGRGWRRLDWLCIDGISESHFPPPYYIYPILFKWHVLTYYGVFNIHNIINNQWSNNNLLIILG